ncbi:MAG: hypothetical protein QOI21_2296 [Actinomycetota bacterium]|jgi:hypothetical protein|nr:hypothetical protein [Actinomycetota bacterium]
MAVMSRHGVWMIVGWAVAAGAAAVVGTAALDIVGAGILGPGNQALSQADVTRDLANASSRPPTPAQLPSTSPAPATSSGPAPRGLSTPGGTIIATCDGDQAFLQSWSPAQGFRTDDVVRGPAVVTSIKFKSGKDELRNTVTCLAGEPQVDSTTDDH